MSRGRINRALAFAGIKRHEYMVLRKSLLFCLQCCAITLLFSASFPVSGSENVPHRPFASWADLPDKGEFIVGAVYEESEAYHIWAGHDAHDITVKSAGETYGIDINQGYISVQYGITETWAADLNVGGTTLGWRSFSSNQSIRSTIGLMDS